ncbi:MAG: hypothetical protein M1834_009148 [Cirrosporium novae-zelandiae]|nr:MAG: hypothetical protein M1834_009148 [Cirrosporium novae-zelandiae]
MLTPVVLNLVSFFYPLGNTPAVCLTQDLPQDQKADILLLGCGDARHILFTAYCDARNILLYTLFVDDVECLNNESIWHIYYSLFLDDSSLKLLCMQAEKLHALSISLQSWHSCKYGGFLRICDEGTLAKIRLIWNSYLIAELKGDEKTAYHRHYESSIQEAIGLETTDLGTGMVITGLKSAAPVNVESVKPVEELALLYNNFWDFGVADQDQERISRAESPNPMFAPLVTDTSTLHYATDPLLGFHLATVYAPLTSNSPLRPPTRNCSDLQKVIEAARFQFQAWGTAFERRTHHNFTVRFFSGDAIAFCHTLQHHQVTEDSSTANWYRDPYHLEPLVFDSEDYTTTGRAPSSFNVIDTSNLANHFGAITLLTAASPLLSNYAFSTLYTELLVRGKSNVKELVDNHVCGDFATLSLIFELFPIAYWTNATATPTVNEIGQMNCRLAWKRSTSATKAREIIRWPEKDLAHILYEVYLNMFYPQDPMHSWADFDISKPPNLSFPRYHSGSMAAFCAFVQHKAVGDWGQVMQNFINLVTDGSIITRHYACELYTQLYIFKVCAVPLCEPRNVIHWDHKDVREIRAWKDIPGIVCITLKIPRTKLEVFTGLPQTELGRPLVECFLQGSDWTQGFAVVQLAFGEIVPVGEIDDDNFKLKIEEDPSGWKGTSSLIALFYAPSKLAWHDSENVTVAFGPRRTPDNAITFARALGRRLLVYETGVMNKHNVYITKHRPHQSGDMSVCKFSDTATMPNISPSSAIDTTITANVDSPHIRVETLTGRVNFLSDNMKIVLNDGAFAKIHQTSPLVIAINIGEKPYRYYVEFPVPVVGSCTRVRVNRKLSYVEIVAPIAQPARAENYPEFMYPLVLDGGDPVVMNMHSLNLDCLPILDITKPEDLQWLIPHATYVLSIREQILKDESMRSNANSPDVRLNFKEALFYLFTTFAGLQGAKRSRVFSINHVTEGSIHILVFVSFLRLDMANHTVVLDAAVLPLTHRLMPQLHVFLERLHEIQIDNIKVDDDGLKLWKKIIPAWIERCRQWKHRTSCEYTNAQIPLSTAEGRDIICSCAEDTLPAGFIAGIPEWERVRKHAVRAAISLSFSVPYVKDTSQVNLKGCIKSDMGDRCNSCGAEKSDNSKSLQKCSRCRDVRYCSLKCQYADWKEHKKRCGK